MHRFCAMSDSFTANNLTRKKGFSYPMQNNTNNLKTTKRNVKRRISSSEYSVKFICDE